MANLQFSLNATVPIFVLIVLGVLFRKMGWMDETFASKMNQFVFKIALPVMLFHDLATVDFIEAWNTKFVLFCFFVTVISIAIAFFLSGFLKDRTIRGEFIQASYRSSSAILGIAFIQNIYGSSTMAALMIIGSVPLYNIMAVTVLSIFKPENVGKTIDKELMKKTLIGIAKNPIILGIIVGLLWSLIGLPMPQILAKTTNYLGVIASPMGLMAMGAAFDLKKAFAKIKPTLVVTVVKLVGFCLLFLPLAIRFGFRNEQLIAILVMLGSSTTVASYIMAKNMGHEGVLASSTIMLTTMLSAFTLTFWVFLLRSLGYI